MEASLTCAVCLSLLEEPVTLPRCSHNFCRGCVLECMSRSAVESGPVGGSSSTRSVSCPLCRKLCPLPQGGAVALPVNTTLAEVVKLYRASCSGAQPGGESPGSNEEASAMLLPLTFGVACEKHPGRLVQLYCRPCRRGGCGQCVSEEHHGIFHAVNLIDTVYQEEKLTFFNSLKSLRAVNEKLMRKVSSHPKDIEMIKKEAKMIISKFEEIFKTLETRKKQLLDDLERQRNNKEKEYHIWKKTQEAHKTTIGNFLKECEKLVHECDPQCFLEVACDLNQRVKTQLDLMNLASSCEKPPEPKQKKMDIKSVVNDILALQLTAIDLESDEASGWNKNLNGNFAFKSQSVHSTYCPVIGQEEILTDGRRIATRFMSILELSKFQNMSHEELRYIYYMTHQRHSDQLKTRAATLNKKCKLLVTSSSKNRSSAVFLPPLPDQVNDAQKIQTQKLPSQEGAVGTSFPSLNGYMFNMPPTILHFSTLNKNFKNCNGNISQKESNKVSPAENSNSLAESQVTVSATSQLSSTIRNSLAQLGAPLVTVLNQNSSDAIVENPSSSALICSLGGNATSSNANKTFIFKKENSVLPTFFLRQCETQDNTDDDKDGNKDAKINSILTEDEASTVSYSPQLGSVDGGKPTLFSFSSSERDCFTVPNLSNSLKISPFSSFSSLGDEETVSCIERENKTSLNKAEEYNWQKLPTVRWCEQAVPSSSTILAYSTSNGAFAKKDVSKTKSLHHDLFSSSKNSLLELESQSSPVLSFEDSVRKSHDLVSSSSLPLLSKETENLKVQSNVKNSVVEECVPSACTLALSEPAVPKCSSSTFSQEISERSEIEGTHAQQDSSWGPAVVDPLISTLPPTKENNIFSVHPTNLLAKSQRKVRIWEDNVRGSLPVDKGSCIPKDTDFDVEDLSQASTSSNCSSTSEYFSVAEDKISPRRKPDSYTENETR